MATPSSPSGKSIDVLAVGDASVDYFVDVPHIARADDKAIGRLIGVHGGGMSANVSAGAGYVGASSALITAYGLEGEGAGQIDALRAAGVNTEKCIPVPGVQSWFCFIQLDPTGEKALVGVASEHKTPRLDDVSDNALGAASIVVPLADDVDWALDIAHRARARGAEVAIDLEPATVSGSRSGVDELIGLSDVVFANRATVEEVARGDVDRCARAFLQLGAKTVVLTDGSNGARCYTGQGTWRAAADVDSVADTTGAGDALAGAFLGSWARRPDPQASLRIGVAVASLCVEHIGARTYARSAPAGGPSFLTRLAGVRLSQEAHHDPA